MYVRLSVSLSHLERGWRGDREGEQEEGRQCGGGISTRLEGGWRGRWGGWTGRKGAMGRVDFTDGMPGWTYSCQAMQRKAMPVKKYKKKHVYSLSS